MENGEWRIGRVAHRFSGGGRERLARFVFPTAKAMGHPGRERLTRFVSPTAKAMGHPGL